MSRKRIVQLLTSLIVLSCMVLPVQAAPQVNIVPLVQLLLLSPAPPTVPTVIDSYLWGYDAGGNEVKKNTFSKDEDKLCVSTIVTFSPAPSAHIKMEWLYNDNLFVTSLDGDLSPTPPGIKLDGCIIDIDADPPLLVPPVGDTWKVIIYVDGVNIDEHPFVITP